MQDDHGPIEDEFREQMKAMALAIDQTLNGIEPPQGNGNSAETPEIKREVGFCLLVFKFGEPTDTSRMNYVGNSNREDMIKALEEFIARAKRE